MPDYSFKGVPCRVDYFDSFTMQNRYDEQGTVINIRADKMAEVEVYRPIRKRVIVPTDCVRV